MIVFIRYRPGLALVLFTLVLIAGVVVARDSMPGGGLPTPSIPVLATAVPRRTAELQGWRRELNLGRAKLENARLVQHVSSGARVVYTIDPELQRRAVDYLRAYEVPYAAMVMYELQSGAVLVMAGSSHDKPRLDAQRLCLTPWAPAASVFKLVTAGALLERGVPASTATCYHGGLRGLTRKNLARNPRLDKTCRTLSDAIARSINPVIGKLALRYLDQQSMQQWATRFGFNQQIPFDLAVQPSRADIPEEPLERARTAAGFWHTEISALHGAVIAGIAGTEGLLRWPQLVEWVERTDGKRVIPERPNPQRALTGASAAALRKMMARTTTQGTGRRGFISTRGRRLLPISVGGKTGSLSRRKPNLSYSWFVGFAPVHRPRVAFAVLLGNPPRWRIKASTAARAMLDNYVRSRKLIAAASSATSR